MPSRSSKDTNKLLPGTLKRERVIILTLPNDGIHSYLNEHCVPVVEITCRYNYYTHHIHVYTHTLHYILYNHYIYTLTLLLLYTYTDACRASHSCPVRRLPGRLCPGGGQVRAGLHGDTGSHIYTVYVLYYARMIYK